jgi:hypothetical protein
MTAVYSVGDLCCAVCCILLFSASRRRKNVAAELKKQPYGDSDVAVSTLGFGAGHLGGDDLPEGAPNCHKSRLSR